MNIEEDDVVRPVRLVSDRPGYVRIGENHRGCLGAGHLDSNDLAVWRNLGDDGEDLA